MAPSAPMELLDCVAFLLVDGERFLVERRREDKVVDPGAVAIPGGHLEPGDYEYSEEEARGIKAKLSELGYIE